MAGMDNTRGEMDNIFSSSSRSSHGSIFFGNKDTALGSTFSPPVWFLNNMPISVPTNKID
jgi:hypothetical protein